MISKQKTLDAIAEEQEPMEALLIEWASISSGSHNLPGLATMLKALQKAFSELPGELKIIDLPNTSAKALNLSCRPKAPIQVFLNGHMDTVYGKDHPFQNCTRLEGNTLQGPGVTDMKGGLVIMLKALQAFERTAYTEDLGWEVFINPDEEIGSPHATPFLEAAAKRHHLGLVFESSLPDGFLVRSRKGTASIEAIAHGRAAHAGRNISLGRNAIIFLSEFILKVEALNQEIPDAIFSVGHIEGGGPINVVPDKATAGISIRYAHKEEQTLISDRINALIKEFNQKEGYTLEGHMHFCRAPKEVSPAIEALFQMLKACGKELKLDLDWRDVGGASDGSTLTHEGLPNIDNLGIRGHNIHSDKEYALLDSLVERTQLTFLLLMNIASGTFTLSPERFPYNPHAQ